MHISRSNGVPLQLSTRRRYLKLLCCSPPHPDPRTPQQTSTIDPTTTPTFDNVVKIEDLFLLIDYKKWLLWLSPRFIVVNSMVDVTLLSHVKLTSLRVHLGLTLSREMVPASDHPNDSYDATRWSLDEVMKYYSLFPSQLKCWGGANSCYKLWHLAISMCLVDIPVPIKCCVGRS